MKHTLTFDGTDITFEAEEKDVETVTRVIMDILTKEGFVMIDADDVKNVVDGAGRVVAGEGTASGVKRCSDAALQAMKDIDDAKAFILNVTTSPGISLGEIIEATEVLMEKADPEAQIIWGHIIDESLGDSVRVSIIAAK